MFLIGYTDGENQDIHYIYTRAREKEAGRKKWGKEEEEGEDWEREEERGGKKAKRQAQKGEKRNASMKKARTPPKKYQRKPESICDKTKKATTDIANINPIIYLC